MNAQELFFRTIQTGHIDNLKLQLQNNPHLVNSEDARGFTPLIFATYFDKEAIAKVLQDDWHSVVPCKPVGIKFPNDCQACRNIQPLLGRCSVI